MNVVSASDLLAAASESSAAAGGLPIAYKHDDLTYDMGMLAAFDSHPLDPAAFAKDKEGALAQAATDATQLLVRRVWELPVEKTDLGPVALLPPRTSRLPRSQPPPAPKPLTRWEKFAKEKGIEKKKRSRLVFDEQSGEWKPRWGKERGKDGTHDWLIPVKEKEGGGYKAKKGGKKGELEDAMEEGEDEFSKRDLAKKDRVLKNSLSQLKNISRATKGNGKGDLAGAASALLSAPSDAGGEKKSRRIGKKERAERKERKALASGGSGGDGGAPVATKQVFVFSNTNNNSSSSNSGAAALVAPRVQAVDVAVRPPKGAERDGKKKGKKGQKVVGGGKGVSFSADVSSSVKPVGLPAIAPGEGRTDVISGHGKSTGKKVFIKEAKGDKAARLKLAQGSTASMGKVRGETYGRPGKTKSRMQR